MPQPFSAINFKDLLSTKLKVISPSKLTSAITLTKKIYIDPQVMAEEDDEASLEIFLENLSHSNFSYFLNFAMGVYRQWQIGQFFSSFSFPEHTNPRSNLLEILKSEKSLSVQLQNETYSILFILLANLLSPHIIIEGQSDNSPSLPTSICIKTRGEAELALGIAVYHFQEIENKIIENAELIRTLSKQSRLMFTSSNSLEEVKKENHHLDSSHTYAYR